MTITNPAAEQQLRQLIADRTELIRRRPDLTHMHLPATLDHIVTHLASLEQGLEDLAQRLDRPTIEAELGTFDLSRVVQALADLEGRVTELERQNARQEGDGR